MQLLQVTIYADPKFGGPTRKIQALCRPLAARGHRVQLATFRLLCGARDRPAGEAAERLVCRWKGDRPVSGKGG